MAISHKYVEIEFQPDAIYLTHSTVTELDWANLYNENVNPKADVPLRDLVRVRDRFVRYGFNNQNPLHRISVSTSNVTHFQFKVKPLGYEQPDGLGKEWLFYPPGFELKYDSKPFQDRFSTPVISDNRRVVTVTFTPQVGDFGRQFIYNLWFEAPCIDNGVRNGHMIVIADPVIGSDEV